MRVLVTGAAGFVGRHMADAYESGGHTVIRMDIKYADFPKPATVPVYGCVRTDLARITEPVDLVIHCAYHVGGRAGIDGQPMNLARNLAIDGSLFEWAASCQMLPPRVVYFSSSAAYPAELQTAPGMVRETDIRSVHVLPLLRAPFDYYGMAKLMGEMMADRARQAGVPVTVVRPFSGYGSDQPAGYPFTDILSRVLAHDMESPFQVWGNPDQTRDWVHIDDIVDTVRALAFDGVDGPVNICTGRGVTMAELAHMMMTAVHGRVCPVVGDTEKPMGVMYRVGCPRVMRQYWTPQVSLEAGIARALWDFYG